MTEHAAQACPASTPMTTGARWHLHPVDCTAPDTQPHAVRLAFCTTDGHHCPKHHDAPNGAR